MATVVKQAHSNHREEINGESLYSSVMMDYFVYDVENEGAALGAVYSSVPNEYMGLRMQAAAITEKLTKNRYRITVRYGEIPNSGGGSSADDRESKRKVRMSFTTMGGNERIMKSISNVRFVAGDAAEINYGGMINVDAQGNVAGVDIYVPRFAFTRTKYVKNKNMKTDEQKRYAELTCCVNSDTYLGWDPGEILFVGVEGSCGGTKDSDWWELNFHFLRSPNIKDKTISGIDSITAKGWEYMWPTIEKKVEEDGRVKTRVTQFNVEQVYEEAEFGSLAQ